MLIRLIILLFLVNIFIFSTHVYAKEQPFLTESELKEVNINQFEAINPNLLIYPFKRVGENIKFLLTFNKKDQDEYLLNGLDTRFKELVYIVDFNKTGFIAFSVDRYNTSIGQIKNRAIQLNDKNTTKIKKYLKVLERLRDRYHSGSASWEKIQQAVDTTRTII